MSLTAFSWLFLMMKGLIKDDFALSLLIIVGAISTLNFVPFLQLLSLCFIVTK